MDDSQDAEATRKNAVITGGASGIGLAIARNLLARGWAVLIADMNAEGLALAETQLRQRCDTHEGAQKGSQGDAQENNQGDAQGNNQGDAQGNNQSANPNNIHRVQTALCDVSDGASTQALARQAFERGGGVNLLINNAGVGGPRGKLWEVEPEDARRHFDVNFWGVWNGCRAFAPHMIAQDHPSAIYNVSSENALFCAVPQTAAYIAAKHAVLGLSESLRGDLPDHVHAGTIIPGWVNTGIGSAKVMRHAMPADQFAAIIVPQILAHERFVVSHAFNAPRKAEREQALSDAFAAYAPRYDGDDEYDVPSAIKRLMAQ